MFDFLFGWPKASKCKKALKRARSRLRQVKNKRQAISRHLRKCLAELIQNGHQQTALKRVDQLIEDENLVAAYEMLDHFCEFILMHLSCIRKSKDCPNDINEAVSSLIFASARCGNLPELCTIRKLFEERYGEKFATTAVELFPGNLVNKQLQENLKTVKFVLDDLKYRVVDEIARDICPQVPKVLAIEYYPDWQQLQVKENKGYQEMESDAQINETTAGSSVHSSEVEEMESDVVCVNSPISNPSDYFSLPESTLIETHAMVFQEKVDEFPEPIPLAISDLPNKGETMALASSVEIVTLPPCPEGMVLPLVDYVDDIEECLFSVFKFRCSGLSQRDSKIQFGCDECDMDQVELLTEKPSIRSSRKRKPAPKKRSRRRSKSMEGQGIMDIGYMIYYHKPCKRNQPLLEGIPQSSYAHKRLRQHSSSEKENEGMELVTIPQSGVQNIEIEAEKCESLGRYDSPNVSNQRTSDSLTRTDIEAPLSRALTITPERPKNCKGKMLRIYSIPCPHPSHVHPKLPDYEDIAAKFTALKRENLENKIRLCNSPLKYVL